MTATDICLWSTLIAVAIGFGGRMATGQMALVIGASATAFCWLLYQLTSSSPRYSWTGTEWLWGAGIVVGAIQIVPLPDNWVLMMSPRLKEVLPLWFDKDFVELLSTKWNQLSLAPWETASALATFVSYALLFLVAAQRTRTNKDIERTLCGVSLATIAMMIFAQAQFFMSNSKFFWVYEHPFMTTDSYPLGCFTNRNHLAQFLSLGTAPLIWWLMSRLYRQEQDRKERRAIPLPLHLVSVTLLMISLGGIALTVLMTLSRGGLMAIALTSIVAIGLMCRIGISSIRFGGALLLVGVATSVLLSSTHYESILANRLEQNSGRGDIWQANIKVAGDFPILGTGIGTHADAYYMRFAAKEDPGVEFSHAECGYLQIASESGWAGLTVAVFFILTSFWWCLGSLWNTDVKATSAAAAILASLVANVAHAAVDFFWYTPVCVLLLAFQLACASRLYRLTRQEARSSAFSFPLPRLVSAFAMCGLVAVTAWMWDVKQPALLAEPHRIQAILLARADERDSTDEERAATNLQRLKETLLAAKLDPRDAKLQEAAAAAYMQFFELKQKQAENSMSVDMLRDGVKSSQFESANAEHEWLQRAVGGNLKFLRLASRALKRALVNSPLRAKSYVLLTELNFLEHYGDSGFQTRCLDQALKLRPRDAETLFLVGKSGLHDSDLEKTLEYWRPAFKLSRSVQERIADVVAIEMPPEFFEKEFHPDWMALETISKAYFRAGREWESQQTQRSFMKKGLTRAKLVKSDKDLETMMISMGNTCRELGDFSAAAEVLSHGAKRLPHSYSIRYRLGLDLLEADRVADASEHLQWCAQRDPHNLLLQKMATKAVAERLRQVPSEIRTDRNVEQAGFRE